MYAQDKTSVKWIVCREHFLFIIFLLERKRTPLVAQVNVYLIENEAITKTFCLHVKKCRSATIVYLTRFSSIIHCFRMNSQLYWLLVWLFNFKITEVTKLIKKHLRSRKNTFMKKNNNFGVKWKHLRNKEKKTIILILQVEKYQCMKIAYKLLFSCLNNPFLVFSPHI